MNEDDLARFIDLLNEHKNALMEESDLGADARKPVELDQTTQGRLSRMDAMQYQAMAQATERRRKEGLARIEAAFRRVEEGDYGYCLECGEEIDPKRLVVDPAAPLCIACAS